MMPSRTISQEDQGAEWVREILSIDSRAKDVARDLGERELDWRAPEGGWSIGQVLEHLCIADDSYLARIRERTRDTRAPRAPSPEAEWRPSLMGGVLARSMRSPRRQRAPRIYRPPPRPRPNVLDEFLARQAELVELITIATDLDWRRIRTSSPVTRLIRLNLGDCFDIVVAHAARHVGQMERVRRHPRFPAKARETSPPRGA